MIRDAVRRTRLAAAASIAILATVPAAVASAETADEFVARLNKEFADIALEVNAAGWTQATYINVDTQLLNARAFERYLEVFSRAVSQAKQFEGQPMSPASKRAIELLKLGVAAPAPDDRAAETRAGETWRNAASQPGLEPSPDVPSDRRCRSIWQGQSAFTSRTGRGPGSASCGRPRPRASRNGGAGACPAAVTPTARWSDRDERARGISPPRRRSAASRPVEGCRGRISRPHDRTGWRLAACHRGAAPARGTNEAWRCSPCGSAQSPAVRTHEP